MQKPIQISSAILQELVSRWCTQNKSFMIREHLVPFNVFDVCIVLGLGVIKESVRLEDGSVRLVKNLFNDKDTTISRTVLKLSESTVNDEKIVD